MSAIIRHPQLIRTTRPSKRQVVIPQKAAAKAHVPARRGPAPAARSPNFAPEAHVDYGRTLTPQGGVAITYKDLDQRLRHILTRAALWLAFTSGEASFIGHNGAHHPPWLSIALIVVVGLVNWLIVCKPIEVLRTIEVRPDCMILDGQDLFWCSKMEGGWPTFQKRDDVQVLSGIYGTRFIEYLTVQRFDELDRAPEVLASHLQQAMQQLWTRPF